jgi:hypothetical protein
MSLSPTPSQSDIMTALGNFLVSVLPAGTAIVQGYDNRVPEPTQANSVIMFPLMRERLETNVDTYSDNAYTASVAGTVMTVTSVDFGAIAVGQVLFGVGVVTGTTIAAFGTGTGGVGTYTLSQDNGTIASRTLASGTQSLLQPIKLTVQCDVHGPVSADNAQTISTLFRDEYAFDFFAAQNRNIAPLYADDPRLVPFTNDSQQVELRWIVTAVLQANQTVVPPQQFADQLDVTIIPVEAAYPA